jgi:hypothetical protein
LGFEGACLKSEVLLHVNGSFIHNFARDLDRKVAFALYFVVFGAHEILETIPKHVLDFLDGFIFRPLNVTHHFKEVRACHLEVASFQSIDVEILK